MSASDHRQHIVMFSGGASSWAVAQRVIERTSGRGVVLLFADTMIEDEDLYRFIDESTESLGVEVTRVSDGRTPWEVFRDVRLIGNTRADPCSRVLKRELLRNWLEDNCDPESTTVYLGFGPDEEHRATRASKHWDPWTVAYPLLDHPQIGGEDALAMLDEAGINPPRLYSLGFPHNNCGGFCVKAGAKWFKLLLEVFPDRYLEHEAQEESLRAELGDVAILRDRRGGVTRPLPMRVLRERIEADPQIRLFGDAGCSGSCFAPATETT